MRKRIIFRPLKDEYQTILIRCTTLEKFVNPPEFIVKDPRRLDDIFAMWTQVHEICHNMATKQKYRDAEKALYVMTEPSIPEDEEHRKIIDKRIKEAEWIIWNIPKYKEILKYYDIIGNYKSYEQTFQIEIECSWYLVILQGTMDAELMNDELLDYKTASTMYTEEMVKKKRQQYYYTVLHNVVNETEQDKYFTYLCITKHKKAQHWAFRTHCDYQDSINILKRDLKAYLIRLKEDEQNSEVVQGDTDWEVLWDE